MSNKSSVSGKYIRPRRYNASDKAKRYDAMILHKQRKAAIRKRKQERQNRKKGRKNG